ncbi:MAG: hypothetical protein A3A44_01115 [Candidatus Sungbacteria bacterium RIFCSPLOWO2_01_FULL_60_25]|uniref:AI-2E family transporter n=1 Tax=Candidatus Sungbacteria bacterium RIFCSPLOWO2_01_FULL_60_25 TaxID=1802281 RepID=A0A1G2LDW7_9BACT|nr:MAG: hypothetical protein A3A44_01115 [Candidatus Sungbacteria bacterium RIFCSPLOWO2_01_FULL_60_25]
MPEAPNRTTVDITYGSFIRAAIVIAVVAALVYLSQIVVALLFAVVIASGIEPGVRWFARFRVPRIVAVLLIYVIAIAVIVGALYLVVPPLVDEVNSFLQSVPRYQRILLQELRSFQDLPFFSFFSENAESIILNPPVDLRSVGSGAIDIFFTVFGGIFSGVVLVVVSFYLASQEKGIEHFLRLVTPLRDEGYVIDLWMRTHAKLGRWLRGQLLLGFTIGVVVYLALSILGIKYALSLALIAAIFELIPIIGPILAAVPAVFLGFLKGPELGLTVAVAYFLIQQLESHLLVPVVMRQAVGLNPLLVIIALLVGGKLGGVMGMFLAVPVASVLVEFLTDTDRRRRLFTEGGAAEH